MQYYLFRILFIRMQTNQSHSDLTSFLTNDYYDTMTHARVVLILHLANLVVYTSLYFPMQSWILLLENDYLQSARKEVQSTLSFWPDGNSVNMSSLDLFTSKFRALQ